MVVELAVAKANPDKVTSTFMDGHPVCHEEFSGTYLRAILAVKLVALLRLGRNATKGSVDVIMQAMNEAQQPEKGSYFGWMHELCAKADHTFTDKETFVMKTPNSVP